jgi:hypothetical protein
MDAMRHVFESVALIGALIVYLVPAMEADVRNHDHALGITLVNVLLGWTIVGWFAALRAERKADRARRHPRSPGHRARDRRQDRCARKELRTVSAPIEGGASRSAWPLHVTLNA